MSPVHVLILLITGVGAGFSSGLLGVGGGFIMIPAQFWLLKSMGIDPTIKYIFVIVLIYIGLKMAGFFEWLHDPI